ncbi:MAG: lytic murein transglycosylase B [Sedimenticola sp.]|nr:lytic murein transglycosylase B [Sedimenticola sp.]
MPKRILLLATLALSMLAVPLTGTTSQQPETVELVQELVEEQGYDAETLRRLLATAQRSQRVIDSLDRPAETVLTWKTYRPIFLKQSRIEAGVAYWRKHETTLKRAEEVYGVAPEMIVAIIGVETFYGRRPGNIPVLDALYTQAYHYPRRHKFGRSQLKAFLQILMEEEMEPGMAVGSYAGAMGTPQFIPTSYLHFAVDFDQDGKRDIWNNDVDVIGSVANYFKRHQWQKGAPVALPIDPLAADSPHYVEPAQRTARPEVTLAELKAEGVALPDHLPDEYKATVINLQGADGNEFWLGLDNFYTITRYNHSNLYAMAAYQLSQEILQLKTRTDPK